MPDKSYKQIVILSGKGGTGKTTLSAALASLINNKIVIDCDVDAANLHLILKPTQVKEFEFTGGKKAKIEYKKCIKCGKCRSVCKFEAINEYEVDTLSCEGCGFCYRVCPQEAISFNSFKSGTYFECLLPDSSKFYYARLLPGEGNSGKLVSEIKRKALENVSPEIEWVIVDGPPGVGCPVNASIASADYIVAVTEPTLSGFHDLQRLIELLKAFNIKAGIVINKFDLNMDVTTRIFKYSDEQNVPVIGSIPFDKDFVNALINGDNIVEINEKIREEILTIWKQLEFQVALIVY
ncbi:MAG: ATP-binding protein [Ignavibacteria bacterium]|jgi:MinD superfamily P-loop ATPase